jgi:hypothetical protein
MHSDLKSDTPVYDVVYNVTTLYQIKQTKYKTIKMQKVTNI